MEIELDEGGNLWATDIPDTGTIPVVPPYVFCGCGCNLGRKSGAALRDEVGPEDTSGGGG